MNKLVRNGQVAVLYSPGFGAGWSTWNKELPELVFDAAIVKLVEADKWNELATYVALKYPKIYDGGMLDLQIAWITEGSQFRINEYDGAESIEVKNDIGWFVA